MGTCDFYLYSSPLSQLSWMPSPLCNEGAPTLLGGGTFAGICGSVVGEVGDKWVHCTTHSYRLKFWEFLPLHFMLSNVYMDWQRKLLLCQALNYLLSQGEIVPVPQGLWFHRFYSNVLLVLKTGCLVDIGPQVSQPVSPGADVSYGVSAYCNGLLQLGGVPIFPPHQRFLRFAVVDWHFQSVALPFSLPTAPLVFTKVLAPMLGFLLVQGMFILRYLNNLLIKEQSVHNLESNVFCITLHTLENFSWVLNLQKFGFDSLFSRQR